MKLVKVLIPFIDGTTGVLHEEGKEVVLSEATIERTKAISVNMVLVLGDTEEEAPKAPKKPRAKKAE